MIELKHPVEPALAPNHTVVRFRLYVAGNLPNSRRAVANLRAYCAEYLPGRYELEILDVYEVPERALEDRIALTPQLLAETAHGTRRIAGDLSDKASLVDAIDTTRVG